MSDQEFEKEQINDVSSVQPFKKTFKDFFITLWSKPETKILLLLIFVRMFFILFTHWGMDFDFYIENAQKMLSGQQLYVDFDSTHMPLVDLIYLAMYFLCPWKWNEIAVRVFLKLPFLLTDIGITLAVMKIIEYDKKKQLHSTEEHPKAVAKSIDKAKLIAGLFVALSLPLIFQTGGGRYDSLMIFCFTMVVFYLQRENWFGVAFFAALGTSAKYIGIIFIPFVFFWMKKKDIKWFILGLLVGFLPIYPFLITCPEAFFDTILNRGSHIAYGFSIWHGIFIIWNNYSMKYVDGIEATYDSSSEPWFVKDIYFPLFTAIYFIILTLFVIKYWKTMRQETISQQPINLIINLVFIPLFIFSLTFKAINIQVLAWFIPYIALKKKLDLTLEYSFLTIFNGVGLIFFESYQEDIFLQLSAQAAGEGSPFYTLVVQPVLYISNHTSEEVWVSVVLISIIWFLIRTTIELVTCVKEVLYQDCKYATAEKIIVV